VLQDAAASCQVNDVQLALIHKQPYAVVYHQGPLREIETKLVVLDLVNYILLGDIVVLA